MSGQVLLRCNSLTLELEADELSQSFAARPPHKLRKIAGTRMVYSVPLILFQDDVSGNVSKQWNKHYAVYASNANIPRRLLEKEFCVRFVTASPHLTPPELMKGVRDSIKYVEAALSMEI